MEFAIAIPQTYPDPVRLQRFLKRAEDLPFDAVWCIEQVIGTAPVLESDYPNVRSRNHTTITPGHYGFADRST